MQQPDYLVLLKTLNQLPFGIGKKTLADIVLGLDTKNTITNDTYVQLSTYGSLSNTSRELIYAWIKKLIAEKLIAEKTLPQGWRVIEITPQGRDELENPKLYNKKKQETTKEISQLLTAFKNELSAFNKQQQTAIVAPQKKILCIAGAGAGKTTVLVERIKFLIKYKGVRPQDILAITFTRKARQEMRQRLNQLPVNITTFNSFCEKTIRKHNLPGRVISYSEKVYLLQEALKKENTQFDELINEYFTTNQITNTSREELKRRLLFDIYGLLDHFANINKEIPLNKDDTLEGKLLRITASIKKNMQEKKLRDFSMQVVDVINLFKREPKKIPRYKHVLIDEYQDVNDSQVELIKLLNPENLFAVGDPRQSIFGWRGSKIKHIKELNADITISLTTNYRCSKKVVSLMNNIIKPMLLDDIIAARSEQGSVSIVGCGSEEEEKILILTLLKNNLGRDIFLLARTNKQLEEISTLLTINKIEHKIRREEDTAQARGLVLSTVHAIKGLEADLVIVAGVSNKYFPCKVSDHPVMDLIKEPDYDKVEEERRLLYVAVSRAKNDLVITYSGTPSKFLDCVIEKKQKKLFERDDRTYNKLRQWRNQLASSMKVPAYVICSDKTLREISNYKPQTLYELKNIYGLGDTKVQRYGEEILKILHG